MNEKNVDQEIIDIHQVSIIIIIIIITTYKPVPDVMHM